jgi:hypothetical protein
MKTIRKLFTAAICTLIIGTAFAQTGKKLTHLFAGGVGTAEDPYRISTPQHLSNLRLIHIAGESGNFAELDDYFAGTDRYDQEIQRAGNEFAGSLHYQLVNDIDISSYSEETWGSRGWKPIEGIGGSLDGNGYKVTGLWVDDSNEDISGVGLFELVYARIEHLGVVTDERGVKGRSNVGGIAGMFYGYLSDCYVSGNIGGYGGGGNNHVGGLVGRMNAESIITDCYMTGHIDAPRANVGGLVGDMVGWTVSFGEHWLNRRASLANSYFAGKITVVADGSKVGGLVCDLGLGKIDNCYVNGDLIAVDDGENLTGISSLIGGLVMLVNGTATISNCYVAGMIGDGTEGTVGPVISKIPNVYQRNEPGEEIVPTPSSVIISNCYFLQEPDGINSRIDPLATQGYHAPGSVQERHPGAPLPFAEGAGIGKTAAEMQYKSSFAGFDFDDVWAIDEGSSLPYLRNIAANIPSRSDESSLPGRPVTILNAWASDGMLHISGLTAGEEFRVYNIRGQVICNGHATTSGHSITLPGKGVYIVTAGSESVKVIQ